MVQSYAKETDLEIGAGNYRDCIYNSVRGVQKYIDQFYDYIPRIYPEITAQNGDYLPLVSFLFSENENIFKYKGISFMVESSNLITRKFESLRSYVNCHNNIYILPDSAFSFIYDKKPYLDMMSSSFNIYSKKNIEKDDSIYKFMDYMNSRFEDYPKSINKDKTTKYDSSEFIILLDTAYLYFSKVMVQLKDMAEASTSTFATAKVIQNMIDNLVMSYTAAVMITVIENK